MHTLLLFFPLILVSIFGVFAGILIIDEIRRQERKSKRKYKKQANHT
jgi:hypothetical protein